MVYSYLIHKEIYGRIRWCVILQHTTCGRCCIVSLHEILVDRAHQQQRPATLMFTTFISPSGVRFRPGAT